MMPMDAVDLYEAQGLQKSCLLFVMMISLNGSLCGQPAGFFLSCSGMMQILFLIDIILKVMEEPDPKMRQQLTQAQELFLKGQFVQSRKVLAEIKMTHLSIELNSLLCEYKDNPLKLAAVLKKMMDIRVTVNIKLFQERAQAKVKKPTPRPPHELYFWNILVLSQLLNNPEVTELIANEALQYADCMRTQTSLMILYQSLKGMEASSRLASCIGLIEKQNRLLGLVKKLTKEEQAYRFMNQILYCKVLLKLGMIDGGRIMYMMKFNQSLEESSEDELSTISDIHIAIHQALLHAQIEYHACNYSQALKLLAELLPKVEALPKQKELVRAMIDHNVALVLLQLGQAAPATLMMHKTLTFLTSSKDLEGNNERSQLVGKCRDNLLLASLLSSGGNFQKGYESLKSHPNCYSFKLNYRKAQMCLEYYHQLLKNQQKVLPYQQIHDFYQTLYYYPNMPYFQQKGKNKNPYHASKKFHYRRYILSQSLPKDSQNDSKSKKRGMSEDIKEEVLDPLQQILRTCEWLLKEALLVLEREKSTIVNLQEEEKNLTEQVNEKLYSEYINFKGSIYCLLCYVFLCQGECTQTLHYASLYQSFQKQYQLQGKNKQHQDIHYKILTYKTQAYSRLNRTEKAYQVLHQTLAAVDYGDTTLMACASPHAPAYFEMMTPYNNFAHNLSVLHSRDNKIPEAYNSIQKLLQQLRLIPTNPQANIPLSLIELLVHYNLRTSNELSALQLLKRRRILNLPGVIGQYPTLNITK